MGPKKGQKNKKVFNELNDNVKPVPVQRKPCLCEASIHGLINNCLNCGRIVCEKEGSGDCFTCGVHVFTKSEREFFLSNSAHAKKELLQLFAEKDLKLDSMLASMLTDSQKRSENSFKDISESLFDKEKRSFNEAMEHKNKLLEFDRNSVARTTVYDDQVDYFTLRTQNFIDPEKRKEIGSMIDDLVENKFKKENKLEIDFKSGTISDTQESVIKDLNAEHRKLLEMGKIKTDYETVSSGKFLKDGSSLMKETPPPVYLPSEDDQNIKNKNNSKYLSLVEHNLRVQDKEQDMLEDKGMCLAMRQPWASLLVAGIKKFEGRGWYSPFKGRLWIYAAAYRPTNEEIEKVEQFYRHLGVNKFPKHYPVGEMIGCVTIEDCLPNSVYSELYPECEIDSKYAFICIFPIQFQTPIPVKKGGGDKIYQLSSMVHRQCKRALGF